MKNFAFVKLLLKFALCFLAATAFSEVAYAQNLTVKISFASEDRLSIEGRFLDQTALSKNISFLRNYADADISGDRIEDFKVFDADGGSIDIKRLIPGEYLAANAPNSWKCRINLAPSAKITDAAHISWLKEGRGILMLADLLPKLKLDQSDLPLRLQLELPKDFRIATAAKIHSNNRYDVFDPENAVFFVSKDWREKNIRFTAGNKKQGVNLAIAGDWLFSDEEMSEMVSSIFEEYRQLFGEIPLPLSQIILSPFPTEEANSERWRAETRGSTVTIISGKLPFKSQAIQRLHEQLRHEILHLWIPNGLNLSGNYDWFYEGFAVYQALKTGVELNQIRFEDYLNTLGRAYDLTQIVNETQRVSLIESSKKRWQADSNFLYAKGMIVAFLCDLTLLRETRGKQNLKRIFRQVYEQNKGRADGLKTEDAADGNAVILKLLRGYPELRAIVDDYIGGTKIIEWRNDLESAGIIMELQGFRVKLKISEKANGRQKDLLSKLGYNQWRKILQKKK